MIPFVLMILLGVGALALPRDDVRRILNGVGFGWLVLDHVLPGDRGEHL